MQDNKQKAQFKFVRFYETAKKCSDEIPGFFRHIISTSHRHEVNI